MAYTIKYTLTVNYHNIKKYFKHLTREYIFDEHLISFHN